MPAAIPPADTDAEFDVAPYLQRLGLGPKTTITPDLAFLRRLQSAHVTTVPFENLEIVGDPHDPATEDTVAPGPGIDLSIPALSEKLLDRERGGYCFELNGLFTTLLEELGYDADRVAARVTDGITVPANHHSIVVTLDQRYVVDVGTGAPMLRQPIPFDGSVVESTSGVEWRVTDCPRPDEDFQAQYRKSAVDEWTIRYVFSHEPRDLSYFHATNEYLSTAPESTFTQGPTVQIATTDGYLKLTPDVLVDPLTDETLRPVDSADWHDALASEFGISLDAR